MCFSECHSLGFNDLLAQGLLELPLLNHIHVLIILWRVLLHHQLQYFITTQCHQALGRKKDRERGEGRKGGEGREEGVGRREEGGGRREEEEKGGGGRREEEGGGTRKGG